MKKNKSKSNKIALIKAKNINYLNYRTTYLKSSWWKKRRELYWKQHKRICFCCGDFASELHHNNYSFLYREQNKHLVPLCNECHLNIHNLIDTDSDFELGTAHIIYKKLLKYNNEFEIYDNHLNNI